MASVKTSRRSDPPTPVEKLFGGRAVVVRGAREKPASPDIYRLDLTQPDSLLLSTQFQLRPLDVVYVGTAGAVQFNRLVNQVLPTLTTIFYLKQLTR